MTDSLLALAAHPRGGRDPAAAAPDAEGAALLALRRYVAAVTRFRHAVADRFGVGVTEVVAMVHLAEPEDVNPRELAARLDITPSSVTALLDRLEAAGLARRRPHPTDRRKTRVAVTDQGAAMLDEMRTWLRASLASVDEADLTALTRTLGTIADALEGEPDAG